MAELKESPAMSQPRIPAVCIPMNLDAFILNDKVCDSGLVRIAPITQPDYHGLRPDCTEIRADILPPVDVHRTQPATLNSRISAVETLDYSTVDPTKPEVPLTPPLRTNRVGVHLHWCLPRLYRAATASAQGVNPPRNNQNPTSNPTFRPVPNRWLVIRSVKSSAPAVIATKKVVGWVIDSDRLWNVNELGPDVDLETEVSPYVMYTAGDETSPDVLNKQAAVYIGEKMNTEDWTERGNTVARVPLTAMNSSNFSFPDNTMHNANVFSMIDNLDSVDASGKKVFLDQATCQYTVLGWHSDPASDPLGPNLDKATLVDRLEGLLCTFSSDIKGILGTKLSTRLVSYGTIYNVGFNRKQKPITPAEKYASSFTTNIEMEPVSIGTTGLDAILSFLQAHKGEEDAVFGVGSESVAKEILELSELLYASEDNYDTRTKAADIIYAHNFQPLTGGTSWHFDGKAPRGGAPAVPDPVTQDGNGKTQVDYLMTVNDLQYRLDCASRKLQYAKWSLFALWWNFVSDPNNMDPALQAEYKEKVDVLRTEITALNALISNPTTGLQRQIEIIVRKIRSGGPVFPPRVPTRSIPQPSFFQRRDPALCIAGMDSGWDPRYLEPIPARLSGSIEGASLNSKIGDVAISQALAWLLREALSTTDHSAEIGYKNWNNQPWVPLFIEWEAVYTHIPFDKWSVQILNSPVGNNHAQVRYGIKKQLSNDPKSTEDQRTVSGRIIILPQPAVNLKALVEQILDTPGVTLTATEKTDLLNNVGDLKFASADLSGLTANLITVFEGSHIQPNLRIPGEANGVPLAPAVTAGLPVGITTADMALIGGETAATPYGNLVDFSTSKTQPFKSVTHGQLFFTKLNIVDKFGQVISGIPPRQPLRKHNATQLPPTINPCLGDQVCPSLIEGTEHLNTVTPITDSDTESGYPLCPYVQLSPGINQGARLVGEVLVPVVEGSGSMAGAEWKGWRVGEDWEGGAWGWVIINYADYGLQFFTADGTFYVELSLGGPTGTIATSKFLPFDPPTNPSPSLVSPQLVELIAQMTDPITGPTYLRAFFSVIVAAVETMPYAPADYAAYATSIVGKPLALINCGMSLELAGAPLESQTTRPPKNFGDGDAAGKPLLDYQFPVKIGDKDRPYDGMVGYWDTENNATSGGTHWSSFRTYFPGPATTPPMPGDPREAILPENFPLLSPYYIDPSGDRIWNSGDATGDGRGFRREHAKRMLVKTMLIDPWTQVHLYSPVMPIKGLGLVGWKVQEVLGKMSAFFKLGPTLLTTDVPIHYDATSPLDPEHWVETQQSLAIKGGSAAVRLPIPVGSGKGVWSWLQPYAGVSGRDGDPTTGEKRYNALDVGEDDGRMRLDPAPYTAVEGFLLLTKPLGRT